MLPMLNITLRNLRAFVAVARSGSFTKAAEHLSVSQPALTTSIRQLETAVGVRLFDRSTRRVGLTVEGQELLPSAERILHDSEEAVRQIRDLAERRHGSVGIACVASFARNIIGPAMLAFAGQYPGINVRVRVADSETIRRLVLENEVDLGYAGIPHPDPDLRIECIMEDDIGLLCPRGHPLSRIAGPVAWIDTLAYDFIGLANSDILGSIAAAVPEMEHRVLPPKYEIESVEVLRHLITAGLGVTAQPESSFPTGQDDLTFVRVATPTITRKLHFISCNDRSLSTAADSMRVIIDDEIRRWRNGRWQASTTTPAASG